MDNSPTWFLYVGHFTGMFEVKILFPYVFVYNNNYYVCSKRCGKCIRVFLRRMKILKDGVLAMGKEALLLNM